jgi:hypothetical protein
MHAYIFQNYFFLTLPQIFHVTNETIPFHSARSFIQKYNTFFYHPPARNFSCYQQKKIILLV